MAYAYADATRKGHCEHARPFVGLRVYYSGTIRGVGGRRSNLARRLVAFMAQQGADVLSEHVAAATPEERDSTFRARTSFDLPAMDEPWKVVRHVDTCWVDAATHLVAVVDEPSLGVGMEIERALLKPQRGLVRTPILCLVHESRLENLSWMVRGVAEPDFYLRTYGDVDDAERLVAAFLDGQLPQAGDLARCFQT